ncbi:MAG: hypothetical protein ABW153_15205, partial [Sedimenticola sp.]
MKTIPILALLILSDYRYLSALPHLNLNPQNTIYLFVTSKVFVEKQNIFRPNVAPDKNPSRIMRIYMQTPHIPEQPLRFYHLHLQQDLLGG